MEKIKINKEIRELIKGHLKSMRLICLNESDYEIYRDSYLNRLSKTFDLRED